MVVRLYRNILEQFKKVKFKKERLWNRKLPKKHLMLWNWKKGKRTIGVLVAKARTNLFAMVHTMVQSLNLWHLMQKKQAKPIYAGAKSLKTHHFAMVRTGICS